MVATLTIVSRDEIRAVSEVVENGERHFLGEQRDFRRHPALEAFLGQESRLGMAWVRLGPGEVLAPHQHPLRSLILVARGRGVVIDQGTDRPLRDGDAVLVPAGHLHGFRGLAPDGIEGLSIQFETRGLYEDEHRPLVNFAPK